MQNLTSKLVSDLVWGDAVYAEMVSEIVYAVYADWFQKLVCGDAVYAAEKFNLA